MGGRGGLFHRVATCGFRRSPRGCGEVGALPRHWGTLGGRASAAGAADGSWLLPGRWPKARPGLAADGPDRALPSPPHPPRSGLPTTGAAVKK
jgi:hypothetical protein